MFDVLIKNGMIIDGTGKDAFRGNVGIKDGKIYLNPEVEDAERVIDAKGLTVTPGFIDAHSHGDLILGTKDAALFKTTQGVTTEHVGQCGLSVAPIVEKNMKDVQNMLAMGTTFFPDDMKNWNTFARFLEYADRQPLTANVKMYVGHSTLRISVMGMENRPATPEELEAMKAVLKEAMESGAAGFSTGLIYTPSVYATKEEIIDWRRLSHLMAVFMPAICVMNPTKWLKL